MQIYGVINLKRRILIYVSIIMVIMTVLRTQYEMLILPVMTYTIKKDNGPKWTDAILELFHPLYQYVSVRAESDTVVEDEVTYEMILKQQAEDEEHLAEDLEEEAEKVEEKVEPTPVSYDQLNDFDYLVSHYYTVDSTTTVFKEQLNAKELLAKNMKINKETKGPKVLIFHTHSQETFADSKPNDPSTSIVGMGAYLAELLNQKGVETMHHDGVYDLINGELDRSKAYEYAVDSVEEILNQNPSIEVVIDLHRDGVGEDTHLVTEVNGEPTAKIMYFNGLSYTNKNGAISYLPNPYLQDNLAFSLQMQLATEELFPGMARKIYLKGYRYSLHLMPKSLLIEAGAQTNTVEEMRNAMEALAEVLYQVVYNE